MRSYSAALVFTLLLLDGARAADWKPPENPDPSAILNEAADDTRARRFDDALAKHIWYHRNALKLSPSQYGVRLSFALTYWKDLADQFEPAMQALKEERDLAKAKVLKGDDVFRSFHEYAAFNGVFEDYAATRDLFLELDKQQPASAAKAYRVAQPALIRLKDYKTCGKYLKPNEEYQMLTTSFQLRDNPQFARHRSHLENSFTEGCATLVGLLAVNDRKDEAKEVAARAKKDWDNAVHGRAIDEALTGKIPEPKE